MQKKYDVVALGELLVDFAPAGTSEQGNQFFEACPGGAPCNVLSMLNKLGKKTAFIGKVGNDQFGKLLKGTIDEIGIDSRGLLLDEDINTTLAFVHTFPDGDRDFSFYRNPGADMMLRDDEIDYDLIRQAKVFHFGTLSMTSEPVRTATKKCLEVAKEAGCLISFDPNLRPPLWESLDVAKEMMEYGFGYCDILKISDNEIQFVSGKEDYDEGIRYLIEKYNIPLIFLTMGKEGSRAYYKGNRIEDAGFVVNTIETTGAGDTFCGSAIDGVLEHGLETLSENSLKSILTFANAAAAIVTTKKGAIRAMPNPENVMALIKEQRPGADNKNSFHKKYLIDTEENKKFLEDVRNGLFHFGIKFPSPGGGSYYLGDDGTPWKERNRETWITSRMVHVYSMASMLGFVGSGELVDAGLKGLTGELHDVENGGWYAGLTADGAILPTKQCYAHAFVILAASSAYLAGRPGAKELLDEALATYDKFFWNEEEGLSCDTWNTEFTVLDDYRGLNANMHTVEAFLAAADVTEDDKYRVRAGRIIDNVAKWAAENEYRIPEHFSKEWVADLECNKEKPDDPFKPYGATPGHGLEWARLITQWATSTFEDTKDCVSYLELAEKLYNRAVEDAWNADGAPGIVYTTDWEGKPVVRDRMHWTLAEAINTAAVLYRVTGKKEYADNYAEFMLYLDERVLDHIHGSWFHQLDCKNNVIGTVWPGKSDLYHAVQATLIPYHRVNYSICPAVKELM